MNRELMIDALTKQALIFLLPNALEFSSNIIYSLTITPPLLKSYFSFPSVAHSHGFLSSTLEAHFPLPVPFVLIGLGSSLLCRQVILRSSFEKTSPMVPVVISVSGTFQTFIPTLTSVLSSNTYIQHLTQCLRIDQHGYFIDQHAQTPNHHTHNKAVPFVGLHVFKGAVSSDVVAQVMILPFHQFYIHQ